MKFILLGLVVLIGAFSVSGAALGNTENKTAIELFEELKKESANLPFLAPYIAQIEALMASGRDWTDDLNKVVSTVSTIASIASLFGKREVVGTINGQNATIPELLEELKKYTTIFPFLNNVVASLEKVGGSGRDWTDDLNKVVSTVSTIASIASLFGKREVVGTINGQNATIPELLEELKKYTTIFPFLNNVVASLEKVGGSGRDWTDDLNKVVSTVSTIASIASLFGKRAASNEKMLAILSYIAAAMYSVSIFGKRDASNEKMLAILSYIAAAMYSVSIFGKRDISATINGQQASISELIDELKQYTTVFPFLSDLIEKLEKSKASGRDWTDELNKAVSVIGSIASIASLFGKRDATIPQLLDELKQYAGAFPFLNNIFEILGNGKRFVIPENLKDLWKPIEPSNPLFIMS